MAKLHGFLYLQILQSNLLHFRDFYLALSDMAEINISTFTSSKEAMFLVQFVGLFVSSITEKTTSPIFMKPDGKVYNGPR